MADLIGQRLGNYEVLSLLGEGGMAAVYRARQLTMRRDVAIKVIESRLARNPDFLKRFEREANTVAELSHAHILKVFDYGQQDDAVYLVMELLRGGSLAETMRAGQLPLDDIQQILGQLASALNYAHRQGIIHRDLKPQNVLFDDERNAYLTDFGIAKVVNETTALTQSGVSMGTPAYMSPEQCRGATVDSRSDVYALGVMLFEMLAGRVPFQADTPVGMVYMHLQEPPPSICSLRADLPQAVESVLDKALAKAPEQRFQTAGELAKAFSQALAGQVAPGLEAPESEGELDLTAPRPATDAFPRSHSPSRQQRTGLLAIGAVVILGAVGLLALLLSSRGSGTPSPTATLTTTPPEVVVLVPTSTVRSTQPTSAMSVTRDVPAAIQTPAVLAVIPSSSPTSPFTATLTDIAAVAVIPSSTSAPSQTPTATATETPTHTPSATATETASATLTATPTDTTTSTWTPSPTPTHTPTATTTETPTPDARATAMAMIQAEMTRTAMLWTLTPTSTTSPTPDLAATIDAERTAILRETLEAGDTATAVVVASYTKTPTPIATATPTHTTTNTPAPTLTFTYTPAAIASPMMVAANVQWAPVIQSFEGVDMVQVPAGCFLMGSNDGDPDEIPVHQVCFDEPFWIDRTEVTNAQFARFGGQAGRTSNWSDPDRPREQITWSEAFDFCAQRGLRLPTEAEWEYAARGPDGLTYPWGHSFAAENTVQEANSGGHTAEAGSKMGGTSWVGVLDMSGNVWEWVNDLYSVSYYAASPVLNPSGPTTGTERVVRGGSWYNDQLNLRAAVRFRFDPDFWGYGVGFRCVRSPYALAQTESEPAIVATPCRGVVAEQFVAPYADLQTRLGCPGEITHTTYFAYQDFEQGRLMWRGMELDDAAVQPPNQGRAVVLYADSTWLFVQSARYIPGEDPVYYCPQLGSPASSLTPKRGFGKILCLFPNVHARLGNATSTEWGDTTSFVQHFDGGFLVHFQEFERSRWITIAFFYGEDLVSGQWEQQ